MIRRRETAWGALRVNQQFHALPQNLLPDVAESIVGVVQEALNNVAKYAEVDEVDEVLVTGYGDARARIRPAPHS